MRAIYFLTLRQLSGRWRLAILSVLAVMPVVMSLIMVGDASGPSLGEFEELVLAGMLAGSIVPLALLAIATAAFGNEIEDRTLANLTLTPMPRWKIVVPKVLAAITVAGPLVTISALLTAHIALLGEWNATIAVTVSAIAAVAMYASVFVWLGLASAQAVGVGLLYIVLWEGLFSQFIAGARLLSIRFYAISLMHGLDERRFAEMDHLSLGVATVLSGLVIAGFLLLSVRRLRRMDVP